MLSHGDQLAESGVFSLLSILVNLSLLILNICSSCLKFIIKTESSVGDFFSDNTLPRDLVFWLFFYFQVNVFQNNLYFQSSLIFLLF